MSTFMQLFMRPVDTITRVLCAENMYIYYIYIYSLALQDITDKGNVIKFVENISLE